jgi:hypothetical protein
MPRGLPNRRPPNSREEPEGLGKNLRPAIDGGAYVFRAVSFLGMIDFHPLSGNER